MARCVFSPISCSSKTALTQMKGSLNKRQQATMMHCVFCPISCSNHRHCLVSSRCCASERASWEERKTEGPSHQLQQQQDLISSGA